MNYCLPLHNLEFYQLDPFEKEPEELSNYGLRAK